MQVTIVSFYIGGFGPAQPLLRAQQHTSLTVAGLHGTALGVASILAGFLSPKLVHRFGRATTSWLGLGFFSAGIFMFVFSPPIAFTLAATFITGFGTLTVVNAMVTQLSHHFPLQPSSAVSQASGISSIGYVAGTLTVGVIAGTSYNWRLGLLVVIPASIILYLLTRSAIAGEHVPEASGPQKGSLGRNFWISWFGYVACISTEFATTFWAAALLRDRIGSSASVSTICIVAVGGGMGLGRWFGPQLLKSVVPDTQFKIVLLTQLVGFASLWYSHTLWISLIALLTVGLGLSMQFALATQRLIAFSQDRPDLAIGRSSLGSGIAIAVAPFVLGLLGDHVGISQAYLLVPILIVIALATIITIPSAQTTRDSLSLVD